MLNIILNVFISCPDAETKWRIKRVKYSYSIETMNMKVQMLSECFQDIVNNDDIEPFFISIIGENEYKKAMRIKK